MGSPVSKALVTSPLGQYGSCAALGLAKPKAGPPPAYSAWEVEHKACTASRSEWEQHREPHQRSCLLMGVQYIVFALNRAWQSLAFLSHREARHLVLKCVLKDLERSMPYRRL